MTLTTEPESQGLLERFVVPVAAAVILLLLGLFGYLDSLEFISGPSMEFVALAAFAGVACFFNPCAIPVFPVLLTQIYSAGGLESDRSRGTSVRLGLAGAAGMLTFLALLGLLVLGIGEAGKTALTTVMATSGFRAVRIVAGALILVFGVLVLRGAKFPDIRMNPRWLGLEKGRPARSMFAYGFVYTLLGLGCTAPILGGVTVSALAEGTLADGLLIFLVASLVMAVLMFVTTFVVRSQRRRVGGPWLGRLVRIVGIVFVATGAFLVLEALFPKVFNPVFHPWLR